MSLHLSWVSMLADAAADVAAAATQATAAVTEAAADAGGKMAPPPEVTISGADTAWMIVATALVLLMTPALAFFYGGLTRSKNMLNTMMMSFIALGVITVTWAVAGFTLAFGSGNALIGDAGFVMLKELSDKPWDIPGKILIPGILFMAFQATFAIITPALISGAVVERMRFLPYVLFLVLWSLLVYSPVCHWVWQANGWLFTMGALDFAGGTVVHINAAIAALVAAVVVGRRKDYAKQALIPHNVPLVLLGAGLLWFGWFGFNAGSALGANGIASYAFVATFLAPAATLVVWAVLDLLRNGKVTGVGAATAIVVGLVAITPAAGFVSPGSALALGAIAAFPSYFAIVFRAKTSLDDSLDVVAAHGLGGITGAMLTAVFASKDVNPLVTNDVVTQLLIQAKAVGATIAFSGIMSFIILKAISLIMPLTASDKDQSAGMDITQHGEEAYVNGDGTVLVLESEVKMSKSAAATVAKPVGA